MKKLTLLLILAFLFLFDTVQDYCFLVRGYMCPLGSYPARYVYLDGYPYVVCCIYGY